MSTDKRDDIRQLLNLNGGRQRAVEMVDGRLAQLKEAFAGEDFIPKGFWEDLRTSFGKLDELEDDLVEIYDRRMSHEMILWAIGIASTPEGKAFFLALDGVGKDSLAAGAAWGEKITKAVMARHGLLPD